MKLTNVDIASIYNSIDKLGFYSLETKEPIIYELSTNKQILKSFFESVKTRETEIRNNFCQVNPVKNQIIAFKKDGDNLKYEKAIKKLQEEEHEIKLVLFPYESIKGNTPNSIDIKYYDENNKLLNIAANLIEPLLTHNLIQYPEVTDKTTEDAKSENPDNQ